MGIIVHLLSAHVDRFQQISNDLATLCFGLYPIELEWILQGTKHRESWIERRVWVLKDNLNFLADVLELFGA